MCGSPTSPGCGVPRPPAGRGRRRWGRHRARRDRARLSSPTRPSPGVGPRQRRPRGDQAIARAVDGSGHVPAAAPARRLRIARVSTSTSAAGRRGHPSAWWNHNGVNRSHRVVGDMARLVARMGRRRRCGAAGAVRQILVTGNTSTYRATPRGSRSRDLGRRVLQNDRVEIDGLDLAGSRRAAGVGTPGIRAGPRRARRAKPCPAGAPAYRGTGPRTGWFSCGHPKRAVQPWGWSWRWQPVLYGWPRRRHPDYVTTARVMGGSRCARRPAADLGGRARTLSTGGLAGAGSERAARRADTAISTHYTGPSSVRRRPAGATRDAIT